MSTFRTEMHPPPGLCSRAIAPATGLVTSSGASQEVQMSNCAAAAKEPSFVVHVVTAASHISIVGSGGLVKRTFG